MASNLKKNKLILPLILLITIFSSNVVLAQTKIVQNLRSASLIIDHSKGTILHQENATKHLHPASLTKMMTIYLAFEAIKSNKLTMDQELIVSSYAASRPRSNMNLVTGEKIKVKDAIFATIIKSANDMAVVLAEAISGSEIEFTKKMTTRAHQIGMHHTLFKNASGLHHPAQKTTAYDMAKLAIALQRDFPEYYSYFAKTEFVFKGQTYYGHNKVTKNYPGATGLKTGFVNASGFNLVTSAKRGNTKLIGVVLGGDSAQLRDRKMMALLDKHFQNNNKDDFVKLANNNIFIPKKPQLNKSKKLSYKLLANTKPKATKRKIS